MRRWAMGVPFVIQWGSLHMVTDCSLQPAAAATRTPRDIPPVVFSACLLPSPSLQCELLPRDDALGPDAKARSQFQHPVHA